MSKPISAVSAGKDVSIESVPDILERELSGVVKDWLVRRRAGTRPSEHPT
jgi:hypothetical protein